MATDAVGQLSGGGRNVPQCAAAAAAAEWL